MTETNISIQRIIAFPFIPSLVIHKVNVGWLRAAQPVLTLLVGTCLLTFAWGTGLRTVTAPVLLISLAFAMLGAKLLFAIWLLARRVPNALPSSRGPTVRLVLFDAVWALVVIIGVVSA